MACAPTMSLHFGFRIFDAFSLSVWIIFGKEYKLAPSLSCKAISAVNITVKVVVKARWSLDFILPKASWADPTAEITSTILSLVLLPCMAPSL